MQLFFEVTEYVVKLYQEYPLKMLLLVLLTFTGLSSSVWPLWVPVLLLECLPVIAIVVTLIAAMTGAIIMSIYGGLRNEDPLDE